MLPDALKETIRQLWPQAVALSDDLHAHPELGHEEFHASQTMVDLLRKAGYQVEYPYLDYPTGFRGVLKTGEGPSVALLVEYDALPVVGHACGHNVHGSMSILAAMGPGPAQGAVPGDPVCRRHPGGGDCGGQGGHGGPGGL